MWVGHDFPDNTLYCEQHVSRIHLWVQRAVLLVSLDVFILIIRQLQCFVRTKTNKLGLESHIARFSCPVKSPNCFKLIAWRLCAGCGGRARGCG